MHDAPAVATHTVSFSHVEEATPVQRPTTAKPTTNPFSG